MAASDPLHPSTDSPALRPARGARPLRALTACLALVAAPIVATTWSTPLDNVRARSFELVDAEGRVRGRWRADPEDGSSFALIDVEGRDRVLFFERGEEFHFVIRDAEEQTRLGLSMDQRGNPHVVLLDANQKPRLHAAVGDEGQPSILFVDKDGNRPAGIGVHASGEGWLLPARK